MNDNQALETTHPPLNWEQLKEQAQMLLKTGFLPSTLRTAEQVIAVILTGREINVGMMESLRGINVIQGKPAVSPQLMLALANRTGKLENIQMTTGPDGAEVKIKRHGRQWHTEFFGPKEATALDLMGKDNYAKQAPTMFKWRALAAALRVTFPDAISGLYTPEEMGAAVKVTDDGDMQVSDIVVAPDNGDLRPGVEAISPPIEIEVKEKPAKTSVSAPKTATTKEPSKEAGEYMDKALDLALAMCNGEPKGAEAFLIELTAFEPKDKPGTIVKATWEKLYTNAKWARTLYGKTKEAHARWLKNLEPLGTDEAVEIE